MWGGGGGGGWGGGGSGGKEEGGGGVLEVEQVILLSVHMSLKCWMSGRQCRCLSVFTFYDFWSWFILFAQVCLSECLVSIPYIT